MDLRKPRRRAAAAWIGLSISLAACGGGGGAYGSLPSDPTPPTPPAPPASGVAALRTDLGSPWGMARLPSGEWLVTERTGRLWRLSADASAKSEVLGAPAVNSAGQGGLLDVAIDPDYAAGENWVYLSFSENGAGGSGTAVARARLSGNQLAGLQVIWRQQPKVSGSGHFGSRLAFGRDKHLFITVGERQLGSPAQDLQQTLGKVIRIQRDGGIPAGNPNWGGPALPGIWSLGHRNPQGAALHPQTGDLWVSEHGPQGGDEVNIARSGGNHGWPVKSYGCNYGDPVGDACRIGGGVHAPTFVEPLTYWVPTSIAPSNIAFYDGAMFSEWRGSLLVGALAGQALWRLSLSGDAVTARETVYSGERVRDVKVAPDGSVWMLTDSGKLLRLSR